MIIPFFIPHAGCPHQCVFCNQASITGATKPVDPAAIPAVIAARLRTRKTGTAPEVAFYGGTFTALPREEQLGYLSTVLPFIRDGSVRTIRISTRPDCVNHDTLRFLRANSVSIVELGVQSMDDTVLRLAGRGHTAADTRAASAALKQSGFQIGMQLMPGLPGDSRTIFMETVAAIKELQPDFVRLYPALVIANTPLAKLFIDGRFKPLSLDEAVSLCAEAYAILDQVGIRVIRMGLQSSEELEQMGTVLAGPYHPAFGQLVTSAILLDEMRMELRAGKQIPDSVVFRINEQDLSAAIGQHQGNVTKLKAEFGLQSVRFIGDNISRGTVELIGN